MTSRIRIRRSIATILVTLIAGFFVSHHEAFFREATPQPTTVPPISTSAPTGEAASVLATLPVKGRAPKTGYTREAFGGSWEIISGHCDARNVILGRDLHDVVSNTKCQVTSGVLHDPYTGKTIQFTRGETSSQTVQIDHVVAVSDAWQTGAQQLSTSQRKSLYNDPLELLAVDGPANQQKSDGDAATWLPSNKPFRCQYVARQIAVKKKYELWVTAAEKSAMQSVLSSCPGQLLPAENVLTHQ